jgi:hypothetical protein
MNQVQIVSFIDTRVELSWLALTGAETGNSAILSYRLYSNNGVDAGPFDTEITDQLVTSYLLTAISGGLTYAFKIQA